MKKFDIGLFGVGLCLVSIILLIAQFFIYVVIGYPVIIEILNVTICFVFCGIICMATDLALTFMRDNKH